MILVLTTTDKEEIAQKISEKLLKEKLIACCSIFPTQSSYWWKGKIANEKEFQLVLKTKEENFEKIEKVIKAIHNYDLPEIISIKIDNAGKDYIEWLNSAVK